MSVKLDPVQVEILWKRMVAAVDEAVATLVRVSFSSVIRDFHDYACAIFDADGRLLAQSTQSTPGLLGVLPFTVLNFLRHPQAQKLNPGDVLITNDPWLASGHLIDITVAMPVFRADSIVAYVLCTVHHVSIGGHVGSLYSRDVYEEGLRLPILKLYEAGVPNEAIFSIICDNVREADKVIGDLKAQVSAISVAATKVLKLMDYGGLATLAPLSEEIIHRTENAMSEALRALPEIRSTASVSLNGVPGCDKPVTLAVTVERRGGSILLDFTGTSEQLPNALNVVLNMTRSYCMFTLKCVLLPDVPSNAGLLSPINVLAPERSVLNAQFPAANWARSLISHLIPELIMKAIGDLMPEKLIASSGATPLCYGNFAGQYEDGGTFFAIVTFNGGMGARRTRDGLNSITYPGSVANIPVEVIESESPLVFSCKEFAPHTAGPGRYRGGVGQKVVLRVAENGRRRLKGSIRASIRGSRYGLPVYGLAGGLAAGIEATAVFNNEPIVLGTNIDMVPGDTLEILVPGGGGYGPPLERSREDVERDLRDAMITVEAAETIYDYRRT